MWSGRPFDSVITAHAVMASLRMPDLNTGRGDWIRTSDIPLPKRTLYQAEPRPDVSSEAADAKED